MCSQPVYLRVMLASDAGTVNCCSSGIPELCFRVPAGYAATASASAPSLLPDCRSCARGSSSNLLHAAPLQHDPYTPDSMDSPSPNAIASAAPEVPDAPAPQQQQQQPQHPREQQRAVSPALLKSRLELIAAEANKDSAEEEEEEERDEEAETHGRKSRSSSDVSWQRSHVLTRAWLQGRGQQAYHSFSSDLHRADDPLEQQQQQQQHQQEGNQANMLIPRIAIINASNFESNASSVHLNEEAASRRYYLETSSLGRRSRSPSEHESSQSRSATAATVAEDELQEKLAEKEEAEEDDERASKAETEGAPRGEKETSKNSTRSNSIQSQEANASLKLKAYNKVTERCKRNIVGRKGRCEKCCVIS